MALERVGTEAFEGERLLRSGTWAVDFSADWCPFCRAFLRPFEEWTGRQKLRALLADLTNLETPLWETFAIDIVPTLLVFRDGELLARADGVGGEGLGPTDLARIERAVAASRSPAGKRS